MAYPSFTRTQHLDKKARDLVRLALFSEHRRVPLRREDINKKGMPPPHPHIRRPKTCLVLGSHTRAFNTVLLKAQDLLRNTFAMELVELQARNYRDQDPAEDLQNATGVKKKGPSSPSVTSPSPSPPLGPQPPRQGPKRTSSVRPWTRPSSNTPHCPTNGSSKRNSPKAPTTTMTTTCPATMAASSPGAPPTNSPRWVYSTSSWRSSWSTDGPFPNVRRRVVCAAFC